MATLATVEFSVAVTTPPTVVAVTGETPPRLVVKLMVVPSATGLPNWSVAVAVRVLLLPTGRVADRKSARLNSSH